MNYVLRFIIYLQAVFAVCSYILKNGQVFIRSLMRSFLRSRAKSTSYLCPALPLGLDETTIPQVMSLISQQCTADEIIDYTLKWLNVVLTYEDLSIILKWGLDNKYLMVNELTQELAHFVTDTVFDNVKTVAVELLAIPPVDEVPLIPIEVTSWISDNKTLLIIGGVIILSSVIIYMVWRSRQPGTGTGTGHHVDETPVKAVTKGDVSKFVCIALLIGLIYNMSYTYELSFTCLIMLKRNEILTPRRVIVRTMMTEQMFDVARVIYDVIIQGIQLGQSEGAIVQYGITQGLTINHDLFLSSVKVGLRYGDLSLSDVTLDLLREIYSIPGAGTGFNPDGSSDSSSDIVQSSAFRLGFRLGYWIPIIVLVGIGVSVAVVTFTMIAPLIVWETR
jgi:hypothetical protein